MNRGKGLFIYFLLIYIKTDVFDFIVGVIITTVWLAGWPFNLL